jgi:thioester reductase-like protein
MTDTVLLTGVTGFLGAELLQRLLASEKGKTRKVLVLVRGGSDGTAADRARAIVDQLRERSIDRLPEGAEARVEAVEGDITMDRLGLSPEAYEALAQRVNHILHCAAVVRFDQTIDGAREVNTRGTERMIAFARRAAALGGIERFDYIGTAYVAGCRAGVIREAELDLGQAFHNFYEQSKFEAEKLVRAAMADLPVTIFRPSIIVGDSRSGSTSNFRGFYAPLRLYFKRLVIMVPCNPETHVDLIPVDYVASAAAYLIDHQPARGACYHLAAGLDRTSTIRELCQQVEQVFGVPVPRFVPMGVYTKWIRPVLKVALRGPRREAMNTGAHFLPYLDMALRFDTSTAQRDLQGSGLVAPRPADYFLQILRYAREHWDRRDREKAAGQRAA